MNHAIAVTTPYEVPGPIVASLYAQIDPTNDRLTLDHRLSRDPVLAVEWIVVVLGWLGVKIAETALDVTIEEGLRKVAGMAPLLGRGDPDADPRPVRIEERIRSEVTFLVDAGAQADAEALQAIPTVDLANHPAGTVLGWDAAARQWTPISP